MISESTVLAIIPARGGSKTLPKKNIKNANGKPLIAYTFEAAKQSKYIDKIILSSDDPEIIKVAEKWDIEVPFTRPPHLATDEAKAIDVVTHALGALEKKYDYIVLLQPTSPLRTGEDIDACISLCHKRKAPACVSVCEPDKNPYWMYTLDQQNYMFPIIERTSKRRQELPTVYTLNGAVYVAQCKWLSTNKSFQSESTIAYTMPPERSLDIDTALDFAVFEALISS